MHWVPLNDGKFEVSFHLEVDVLHVHLVQVYQHLVLRGDALLDLLHLEVSIQTRVICTFSLTRLSLLNKILFCKEMVRKFDCSLNFDCVTSCSLCKVHLV